MNDGVAVSALVPVFVAGAVYFAAIAFRLLVPHNREMRWFTAFNAALFVWLVSQAASALGLAREFVDVTWTLSVHLMPALFLTMAWIQLRPALPLPYALTLVVLGIAFGLLMVTMEGRATALPIGALATAWQSIGWFAGAGLLLWAERRRRREVKGPLSGGTRTLVIVLTTVAPFAVVAGSLVGGYRFFVVGLPLIVLATYVALLLGVARLRFYDVEVRVARSGEIAAGAAEMARLAALGELAASFAHEVRNPLTGVRSLAQRLAEDDIADDSRRRYAAVILEETGRIDRIVEHVLSLGRRGGRVETGSGPTELDALFDDLRLLVASRAQRAGVRIETEASGLSAAARRDLIAQALLNLLLNAIAHTPRNGRVTLAARSDGSSVIVSVSDQGPGVPREERERIFEPFYSSRPDGAGLGLSVVRTVARESGWRVDVDDAPDGGACFRLCIPLDAKGARRPVAPVRGEA